MLRDLNYLYVQMKYLRHTHLVCVTQSRHMWLTLVNTPSIFSFFLRFLSYSYLLPSLFLSFPLSPLFVSIYSFWYYVILRISLLWSFFISFLFFLFLPFYHFYSFTFPVLLYDAYLTHVLWTVLLYVSLLIQTFPLFECPSEHFSLFLYSITT
jgi:hypothetical protein